MNHNNKLTTIISTATIFLATATLCAQTCMPWPAMFDLPERAIESGYIRAGVPVDLNSDGLVDLVYLQTKPAGVNNLLVMIGCGQGNFETPILYESIGYSILGTDDFNLDGNPDIAVLRAEEIVMMAGSADGTLAVQQLVDISQLFGPIFGNLIDITADGVPDIVIVDSISVYSMIGNGDGTFSDPIEVTSPWFDGIESLVVADFSGDGVPDLLVLKCDFSWTDFASIFDVYIGQGDGLFDLHSSTPISYASTIEAADFNNDGRLDIAYVSTHTPPEGLYIRLNNGAADFGLPIVHEQLRFSSPFFSADLNNDGFVDLLCVSSRESFMTLLGNGTGTFTEIGPYDLGHGLLHIVADLDQDGMLDLISTRPVGGETDISRNFLRFNKGLGDGRFVGPRQVSSAQDLEQVEAADLNNDGIPDLVVLSPETSTLEIFLGDGHGDFTLDQSLLGNTNPTAFAIADYNQDGLLDLAVSLRTHPSSARIWLQASDNQFPGSISYFSSTHWQSMKAADVNNDAILDLVGTNIFGAISVLIGNADGSFLDDRAYTAGHRPVGMELRDFNNDGYIDAAVMNEEVNTVSILLNNAKAVFALAVTIPTGNFPQAIISEDMNGDSHWDLIICNKHDGTVSVHFGKGDAQFADPVVIRVGVSPNALAVADFDSDGFLDIAVGNDDDANVCILRGSSTDLFQPPEFYGTMNFVYDLAVADFNADSYPDIAVAQQRSRAINQDLSIMLNRGALCRSDFTGDGTLNFFDVSAFLSAFAANEPAADFTNDGNWNYFDVSSFLAAFAMGCP